MTTITLTIPTTIENRVIDGYCKQQGYQDTVWAENAIDRIPNPESKVNFMTRIICDHILQAVKSAETAAAMDAARQAASEAVMTEIAPALLESQS